MAILTFSTLVEIAGLTCLLYSIYGIIYRLYQSPIAKFPGRKLAAVTFWYEFYYDVIKRGDYVWEIQKMHDRYGPIVRINPYELHVKDPSFMTDLYPQVTKNVEKWHWSAGMFGNIGMTFGTVDHNLHRLRRGAFQNFFSKQSIRDLQPVIQSVIDNLCGQLEQFRGTQKPVNLMHAYTALAYDVITEYCFADCGNQLSVPDFAPSYYDCIQKPTELTHTVKQFPLLLPLIRLLPDWFIRTASPLVAKLNEQRAQYKAQVSLVLNGKFNLCQQTSHPTIFHSLRDSSNLPPREKTQSRLEMEAQSLVGAGTLTTAHMLGVTTYHILSNPSILHKLLLELETTIPDPSVSSLQELEKLPYLSAVISEGLRVSCGISHRLQRVHPDATLRYNNWIIPAGTPVSMTSIFIHNDPILFPNPRLFDPARWLPSASKSNDLAKYMFAFGKGTRQCVAINLSYAEIYMTLVSVIRRFGREMSIYQTERERDVDVAKDFFVMSPSLKTQGIRVIIERAQ